MRHRVSQRMVSACTVRLEVMGRECRRWAGTPTLPGLIEELLMSLLPNGHLSGMFIHANVLAVEKCLIDWGSEEMVDLHDLRSVRARVSLADAWQHVDTREPNPTRAFLIDLNGEWTGYFDNESREFLDGSTLNQLCERLRTTTCFFSYDDQQDSWQRGTAHFAVERWEQNRCVSRSVLLYKQSGWIFDPYGDPLPFEDLEAYKRKRKTERLTPELLRKYGEALGVRFWDESCYGTDVALLTWTHGNNRSVEETRKMLIEKWRETKGPGE